MNTGNACGGLSVKASVTLLALVMAGVLGLAAGLVARVRETGLLRSELAEVSRQVREQEILHPLFCELKQEVAVPLGATLPCPCKGRMDGDDIIGIPDRFSKLAESCHLKLGAVRPRLIDSDDTSRQMIVEVQMTGAYAELRPLLLGVLAWPSFIKMERIEVVQQRMHEEFNMSIRLALK